MPTERAIAKWVPSEEYWTSLIPLVLTGLGTILAITTIQKMPNATQIAIPIMNSTFSHTL